MALWQSLATCVPVEMIYHNDEVMAPNHCVVMMIHQLVTGFTFELKQ